MSEQGEPVVGLLHWGNALEDFLRPNGLTLDDFCRSFRGSWLFGAVDALRAAGVSSVLYVVSLEAELPHRRVHEPTGAPVVVLPAPRTYAALARRMRNPYGRTSEETFGRRRFPLGLLRELSPYLATPLRALARELRRDGCAALVVQEYEFPRFDVLALRRPAGVPVFAWFQGGDYRRWRLERLTRPPAMRRAAGLVVGPKAEAERLRRAYRRLPPVARIPNPVDVERWRPENGARARARLEIPEDARVTVWHGRVEARKKGLDVLLDAWERVAAPDRRLLLVGDGPDLAAVAERAASLPGVVVAGRLVGDRDELRGLLAAGDVYVFPSRHEGFAVAPVEAAACGLPVVAAAARGVEDTFPGGEDSGAVVVPREDAPALAAALDRLLADRELARELGARARARALAAFSLDAVGAELRAFLLRRP